MFGPYDDSTPWTPSDLEDDTGDYSLCVDTAGSTDGPFPEPAEDCYIVGINGPYGYELVLVSSRYVGAVDAADAATTAVDAYHERKGHEVPWTGAFGGPTYNVDVWPATDPDDSNKVTLTVAMDTDTGDWEVASAER